MIMPLHLPIGYGPSLIGSSLRYRLYNTRLHNCCLIAKIKGAYYFKPTCAWTATGRKSSYCRVSFPSCSPIKYSIREAVLARPVKEILVVGLLSLLGAAFILPSRLVETAPPLSYCFSSIPRLLPALFIRPHNYLPILSC